MYPAPNFALYNKTPRENADEEYFACFQPAERVAVANAQSACMTTADSTTGANLTSARARGGSTEKEPLLKRSGPYQEYQEEQATPGFFHPTRRFFAYVILFLTCIFSVAGYFTYVYASNTLV